jgi:hypothetical protein
MKAASDILSKAGLDVRLDTIGLAALELADQWLPLVGRRVKWNWRDVATAYRGEPGRFGFSIWSGTKLCGLAVGRVRAGYVGLDYLEAIPERQHPFKGETLNIALTVLRALALAHGRSHIRLNEPLPDLVDIYRGLGFDYHQPKGKPSYCEMKL